MFNWLPFRRRSRQLTDPAIKREAVEHDKQVKDRLQAQIGRDIQPDIDRIVHRAQRGIRGTQ